MKRIAALLALTAIGCAKPGTHVSSEVVWARVDADSFAVAPGDIVRIESSGPVRVTSVIGAAEVTETLTPKDGIAMFRPALGTTTVKVAGGAVVHDGGPRDPEISWFDLEKEALAWAKTPLGTPFPALSPAPRLDPQEAADLDAALKEANVADPHAIRALFALRAIRVLEGARIYPYAKNGSIDLSGRTKEIRNRDFYEVKPAAPQSLTVDGPTVLAVSSRIVRGGADAVAEVRVKEGERVRGSMRSIVHHVMPEGETQKLGEQQKLSDDDDKPDPTLTTLRRVFVHVPPGKHTYAIEITGAAGWVAASTTTAFKQVVDVFSGAKNVSSLAEEARKECSSCAIALALTGGDVGPAFDRALASSSEAAKKVALALGAGSPFDRATKLESEASSGDPGAIAAAARDAAATVDASLREAWARGTLRGTSWQTVDDSAPLTWFTVDAKTTGDAEIGPNLVTLTPEPWRRVQAIRLMATGPCGQEPPIQLEVNGQTLSAQPSAARSTWHIVVPAGPAKVRRLDKGATKVYSLAAGAGGGLLHAALPLSAPRALAYPANTTAPGVEVWLKSGASSEQVTITSTDGVQKLDVAVHPRSGGFTALAEDGVTWSRVATIPLPPSFGAGAKVTGGPNAAVRAVARGVKAEGTGAAKATPTQHASPPNVEAVIAASKKLLAAKTAPEKAAAALERGKLLASFGAERAALDDAELAEAYGAADAAVQVRSAYQSPAPTPQELSAPAYGIEPDFDPTAQRCAAGDGPRAKITALDAQLRARRSQPVRAYDKNLAIEAATLASAAPQDPRGESLVTMASAGSKWKLLRDVEGGGGRVQRPHEKESNPLLDSDARLRPHLLAGDPFGKSYVSVSPDRPARAFVADLGGGKARIDVVCTPRKMPNPGEACPLEVKVGAQNVPVKLDADGRATVELPHARSRSKRDDLNVTLAPSHADYSALIRIVLDAPVAGTTKVEGVGYVLDTPHIQYRFLLPPNKPIRVRAPMGLLRIDAEPEGNDKAEVIATVSGKEFPIPLNGDQKVLPIATNNELVSIAARGGTVTVAVAERVEAPASAPERAEPGPAPAATKAIESSSARMSITDGAWRDTAEKSPRPLGWFADHLGTFESFGGVNVTTLRDGSTSTTALDVYGFEQLFYRRRIESINLFTAADGLVRLRSGNPTYGGSLTLYEDWNATRLRITGSVDSFMQQIDTQNELTLKPRGFIEYSALITPTFYILPRLGYDGYFTSLKAAPKKATLNDVDDDVFNAFRFKRNQFAFLQALFWWVPLFDNIWYVRARGTFDLVNNAFSHANVRPGTFFVVWPFEVGLYADGQYFGATAGARGTSGIDISGGSTVVLHMRAVPGSFEIRPVVTGQLRGDLGYQVLGGLSIVASARRGVRDYSSLELWFPESTGGGVPWRTEGRAGP